MSAPNIISFQTRLDEFYFLGIENLVTENANFGAFWDNFFDKGGYDVIDPYQTDPNCVNIWFNNICGEKIYYQGKFVNASAKIPDLARILGCTVDDLFQNSEREKGA